VIGSKRLRESKRAGHSSFYRKAFATTGNRLIRILLLPELYDTQGGLKVFRSKVLKEALPLTRLARWSFDIELLAFIRRKGFRIHEEAIEWLELGKTQVRPIDYFITLLDLGRIFFWVRLAGDR